MYKTKAYSAASATSPLVGTTIARRDPTEHDVQIEILFCGICHSDLHSLRNEWSEFMPTVYPIVLASQPTLPCAAGALLRTRRLA
jgi:alcohol dehydrogenase (NADP+)